MRDNPTLKNVPLVVSYSTRGSGDVASCNYEARKFGVRSGMWMSYAKELCPQLVVVPYEFEKYEKIATQVHDIFFKNCSRVKVFNELINKY